MFRLYDRYPTLVERYDELWRDATRSYMPILRLLRVLHGYVNGFNSTHSNVIKDIIQPYTNTSIAFSSYSIGGDLPSMYDFLHKICDKIPESDIKPQGSLAAIFEVVKNRTGMDIYTFYANKNKKLLDVLDSKKCFGKVVFLLCGAGEESYSNLFSYLPKEVSLYICQLMTASTYNHENNYTYHLLIELLEGYCGYNDTISDNDQTLFLPPIKKMLSKHYEYQPSHQNAGILLFDFFSTVGLVLMDKTELSTVNIFTLFNQYAAIDITEFHYDSPLNQFFKNYQQFINNCITMPDWKDWVHMILSNPLTFYDTSKHIRFLLSRPYFSSTGKKGMIESLIENIDDSNKNHLDALFHCSDLIYSNQHDIVDLFLMALNNKKYNTAMNIFCYVNQIPSHKYQIVDYYRALDEAAYKSIVVLHDMLTFYKNYKVNSLLVIKLIDYVMTLDDRIDLSEDLNTFHTYNLLLENKDFIQDYEIIESKFLQCFKPNFDYASSIPYRHGV